MPRVYVLPSRLFALPASPSIAPPVTNLSTSLTRFCFFDSGVSIRADEKAGLFVLRVAEILLQVASINRKTRQRYENTKRKRSATVMCVSSILFNQEMNHEFSLSLSLSCFFPLFICLITREAGMYFLYPEGVSYDPWYTRFKKRFNWRFSAS